MDATESLKVWSTLPVNVDLGRMHCVDISMHTVVYKLYTVTNPFLHFSFLIYELVPTLPLDECIIMIYNNYYYDTIVITIFKLYISHACIGR